MQYLHKNKNLHIYIRLELQEFQLILKTNIKNNPIHHI